MTEMEKKRETERLEFYLLGLAVVSASAGLVGFVLGIFLGRH